MQISVAATAVTILMLLILRGRRRSARFINDAHTNHYIIGDFSSSMFDINFLSCSVKHVPSKSNSTVCELTRKISLNRKITFRAWFHVPLYKVEQICARLMSEKIIMLSHHFCSMDKLQVKCELLVLGLRAIFGGVVTQFCQIPTLTNIHTTEHSNFLLMVHPQHPYHLYLRNMPLGPMCHWTLHSRTCTRHQQTT